MPPQTQGFAQITGQVKDFALGLKPGQRALFAGAAVLVAAVLWIFIRLIGSPDYKTLYSGLKPDEANGIAAKLSAKGITYQISPDGASISVPADQLDKSRLETASQGLPRNARLGFELFDTPNWTGTDFTDKVNYQRALEGELERTIQTMGEVESARVHLVMPSESLFVDREEQAKAAVILKTRGSVSEDKQFGIAQLVASAVDKLKPENVTVLDADTGRPFPHRSGMLGGLASQELGGQLEKEIVRTLEPVLGADRVRASVRVEVDSSTSEENQESYDPKSAVAITTQHSEETAGGVGPGGVPGTASNVPPGAAASTVTAMRTVEDQQSSKADASTFVVNKLVRHTMQPAGRLKRIAAAVVVDDALETSGEGSQAKSSRRKRTPEEMKNIEQLAAAAIGLDASRGDVLAVENLSFQQTPVEQPPPPSKVTQVRTVVTQWSSLLRYAGITALFVVVYLIFLRPIKKQLISAFRELPARIASGKGGAGRTAILTPADAVLGAEATLPESSPEQKLSALKRQLADKVKAEPGSASRLIEGWMHES
ncbi:MAG TPA: flagellar basal-body MS-ring/collar protein FliF [Terriglobales bacterium]|nr:flagellar basal-body MS-ring/collar protein FliF [Terriglobales bacterium]